VSSAPRELERARALLEEPAEQLYEEAPCGFLSALPDGTLVRVNRWVTRTLGRDADALVGRVRVQELFTVGGRIYWETHVHPLLGMQGHVDEIALELTGVGRRVPVLLNAVLRRDERGEPIGIRATLLDVTERRRYERELLAARDEAEEAARVKGTLVSMISHDIRGPLSAIVAAVELLEESSLSKEQESYVRTIARATRSTVELLDDVLSVGRIEAAHGRLERRPFDLPAMLEGLVEEQGLRAKESGLTVSLRVAPDVPAQLRGDPVKLSRVLSNLLGNAIKFTERGGVSLDVSTRRVGRDDATLAFEVRDTGIGIPEDQLGRIFDDFTQGSEQIGARYGGTGLGLGICKRLLALHGAQLDVKSEPGRGTTFSFELTLDRAP